MNGERENPEELADQLERDADRMQQRSEELGEKVAEVRQDWERKRGDQSVPGAPPPESEGPDEASEEGNNASADREADDVPAEESG